MIAEFALIYWWISLGLGLHAATLPAESLLQTPKIMFAASLLSGVAIALPKFSALFFYYRIFGDTTRWVYRALWLLGGLNVAWLAAALLSTVFSCTPVQASWTKVEGSHCIQQQPWYLGVAIPSTIIDACIMALPMPMLWGLKASKSRRAFVSFIFICGYWYVDLALLRSPLLTGRLQRYHCFNWSASGACRNWQRSFQRSYLGFRLLRGMDPVRSPDICHVGQPSKLIEYGPSCASPWRTRCFSPQPALP